MEPELTADPTNLVGLGQKLMVWVTRYDGTTTTDILGTTLAYEAMNVPVDNLVDVLEAESQSLVLGTPLVYVLHWEVPGDEVGNEIQGDTAELDITFTLDQTIA
jgi:hypothetical protein